MTQEDRMADLRRILAGFRAKPHRTQEWLAGYVYAFERLREAVKFIEAHDGGGTSELYTLRNQLVPYLHVILNECNEIAHTPKDSPYG